MRVLGGLAVAVLATAAVLVAIAFLLPTQITVTREAVVAAPPAKVFGILNALPKAAKVSPWIAGDPAAKLSYAGPAEGVGNRMAWSSGNPTVRSGSQEIIVSVPDQRVESALDLGGLGVATAWEALKPEGSGTHVTWGFLADTGPSPLARYRGVLTGRAVAAEFDTGLARLKALVEAK